MTKAGKILTIFGFICLAFASFLSIWYLGASYPDFSYSERFEIPGLKYGFVPQGICRIDGQKLWLVSGYMADGTDSRVYLVDEKTGKVQKYFTLLDGSLALNGHFGGIACSGDDVWVVSEGTVYHFYTSDIFEVSDGRQVKVVDKFDSQTKADFCFANEDVLVVGEFNRDGKYGTQGHELLRDDGQINKAYAVVFGVGNGKYGLKTDNLGRLSPLAVYSLPDKVQGFCMAGNKIVLSTSYNLADSKIYVFDTQIGGVVAGAGQVSIMNSTVQLLALWADRATQTITAPAMSEGLDYFDGQVYMNFESACAKYKLFNRTRTKHVLSFKI